MILIAQTTDGGEVQIEAQGKKVEVVLRDGTTFQIGEGPGAMLNLMALSGRLVLYPSGPMAMGVRAATK